MPRKAAPRPDRDRNTWTVQMGEVSARTGRRGEVTLRYEDGRKVPLEDRAGAYAAFVRLLDAETAEVREATGPTAYEVVRDYIRWHEAIGSRPKTIETHKWHLFRFLDFAHNGIAYRDRPAAGFAVADWTRYRKAMQAGNEKNPAGAQTGYVRLAFASVHACWRWAARPVEDREPERLIPVNPFAELIRPRKGRGRRLTLPWATVRAMAAFVAEFAERPAPKHAPRNYKVAYAREQERNRLKALACRLVIECGCRPIEAASLRWAWFHPEDRAIEVPEEESKTWRERFLGLTPGMTEALLRLRDSGRSHPAWAFVPAKYEDAGPMHPRKLAEWFRKARAAARSEGIDLPAGTSLYTFRHTLVTLAREAGMDLRHIAPAFGHSAETAEKTYAHVARAHVVGVMDEVRERIAREAGKGGEGRDG